MGKKSKDTIAKTDRNRRAKKKRKRPSSKALGRSRLLEGIRRAAGADLMVRTRI